MGANIDYKVISHGIFPDIIGKCDIKINALPQN